MRDSLAAVYSSPLRRAVETAAILNDELATGLQPQTHDGLSEGSVGDLEGQSSAEHFARFDATFDHWYLNGDLDHRIGGTGERGSAAVDRISGVVDDLVARHPGQTVLVVGHGTILQLALTALCANLPLASGYRNWIENAGVVDTVHDGRHLHCLSWSGRPPVLAPGLVDAPDTKGDHSATAA
ncbi:histidine phosphatase family protein [Streptomyces sp. LN245]|uniref:histidine phosphatase family protein n=1 Tax=Streptomyces sp. LN245 TaxID=3112975 RepID=UPI0037190D76